MTDIIHTIILYTEKGKVLEPWMIEQLYALEDARETMRKALRDDAMKLDNELESLRAENARLKAELAETHRVIDPFAAYTTLPSMPDNHLCLIEARHLRRARSFRDRQKIRETSND